MPGLRSMCNSTEDNPSLVGLKLTELSRILGYKCVKERERERGKDLIIL